MDLWDNFLLDLFRQYSALLKREFTVNFREIVENDDYMPMPIENREEYDKICSVSWYTDERPPEEITFPTTLPFSQMYPLCCVDIRNFLNKYYYFADDYFSHQSIIDNELKNVRYGSSSTVTILLRLPLTVFLEP